MYDIRDSYRNIRLVRPDDAEYVACMRRMADRRPSRGGPRAAGEYLGGLVERAVRHWLGGFVPLQEERILAWEQRLANGRHGATFRELDAVWQIDTESLCLYEMKLTYPANMENGAGLRQLEIAAETLFASRRYRYILMRLVYVAEERVRVLEELPALEPDDEYTELGVLWVPPAAVEAAAVEADLVLPADWLKPESREGFVEDPSRSEWRQFVEPSEPAAEAAAPDDNPLAEALRKAMERQKRP